MCRRLKELEAFCSRAFRLDAWPGPWKARDLGTGNPAVSQLPLKALYGPDRVHQTILFRALHGTSVSLGRSM